MGGERRRRRLRRAGRGPAADPSVEPVEATSDEPEPTSDGSEPPSDAPERAPAESEPERPGVEASAEPLPPGDARRRSGSRGRGPRPGPPHNSQHHPQHRPSPADLAELSGSFALTAGVQDPEPPPDQPAPHVGHLQHADDPAGERGLRGLVGGGSSQVNVAAAMRARDASRPGDAHVAAAEAELPIVRRGWVPREELPRPGAR